MNKKFIVEVALKLTPINENNSKFPITDNKVSKGKVGQTWCVANGQIGEEKLQTALNYACGEGCADCRPIQHGASCYNPNTLEAHASYALNSYYQKNGCGTGTCDFGGAAYVVSQPPSK